MAKYKNISGVTVRSPFIPGEYAEPGEVVELPDEQTITGPDGEVVETLPVLHSEDIWEPVKKPKATKADTEGDA